MIRSQPNFIENSSFSLPNFIVNSSFAHLWNISNNMKINFSLTKGEPSLGNAIRFAGMIDETCVVTEFCWIDPVIALPAH